MHSIWMQWYLFCILNIDIFLTIFLRITQVTLNTHAHLSLWIYIRKLYLYEHPLKDWAGISRDWRSHHKRLTIDENVAYHWKYNAVKFRNKFWKMRALVLSWGLEAGWTYSITGNLTSRDSLTRYCYRFTFFRTEWIVSETWFVWNHSIWSWSIYDQFFPNLSFTLLGLIKPTVLNTMVFLI
jgi:hypothetical protein